MPRDVEPAVAQLENVFLYDIDDLQAVAAQAAVERRRDIPAAEHIVSEEVERFWAWYGGVVGLPRLKGVRGRGGPARPLRPGAAPAPLPPLGPHHPGGDRPFPPHP